MKTDSIKNTTRGGQTVLHNLRMINQVLNKVLLWTLPVGLLIAWAWFMLATTPYQRYIGEQYGWAQFYLFFDGKHHQQTFQMQDGSTVSVYATQIQGAPFVKEALDELSDKALRSFWAGVVAYVLAVTITLSWLKRRGVQQSQSKHIKGDYLADSKTVKKIIRQKGKLSRLTIGIEKLPLPLYAEMQHFLFHGTTGSGKSTSIKEFLDWIRARGERAIIYDKSCNLVKQFYCEHSDHLLNAFDVRTCDWSLWQECRDKADFESLAAALIPMPPSTQDPFWINAARTIFSVSAFRMGKQKNPRLLHLLRYLFTAEDDELKQLLEGSVAAKLVSEKIEKTATSIKSVLATYLKCLSFVKEGDSPFSIRQWVESDTESSWLFISSLGNKHESLKPLITAWLDIAVNALLSLSENAHRRVWVILDELTSLQQLPYLTAALSEARKFGGCFIIGIQSYAQLTKVYGHDGGREISSLLNTRFMFRVPDPDIAQWSAKNLGETTIEEVREGISYGANTMRDGVSVNRAERDKPLVSYSEVMNLDDLCCYLRLPGQYPVTQLHISYVERPAKNTAFMPREFEQDNLRVEVLEIAEKIESKINSTATSDQAATVSEVSSTQRTKNKKKKTTTQPENATNPFNEKDVIEQALQ